MRHGVSVIIRRASLALCLLVVLSTPFLWGDQARAGTTIMQTNPSCAGTGGITITQPGEYVLGGDVTCLMPGDGIDIEASGVTLHLNGHTISGMCTAPPLFPSSSGIHVNSTGLPTLTMVRILGDDQTVSGFQISGFQNGIVADKSAGSFAKFVAITSACQDATGISIKSPSSQWKLDRNAVAFSPPAPGQLSLGISLEVGADDNDLVLNNVTSANQGISVFSNNNTIVNNTANMNTAGPTCHGIHVEGASNSLHANTTDNNAIGIFVEDSAVMNTISGNTSLGNTTPCSNTPVPYDMDDENKLPTACDNNKWTGNHFMTANQSCIN